MCLYFMTFCIFCVACVKKNFALLWYILLLLLLLFLLLLNGLELEKKLAALDAAS